MTEIRRSAFAVDTPSGRYRLTTDEYAFSPRQDWWVSLMFSPQRPLLHAWDHEARRSGSEEGSSPGHTRLRGFVRGEPVVVIGRKAAGDAVEPMFVLAGTRQSVAGALRDLWGWDNLNLWIAVVAGIATLLVSLYSIVGFMRMAFQKPGGTREGSRPNGVTAVETSPSAKVK